MPRWLILLSCLSAPCVAAPNFRLGVPLELPDPALFRVQLQAADLDQDEDLDLVVQEAHWVDGQFQNRLSSRLNDGRGVFTTVWTLQHPPGISSGRAVLADLDGDGMPDLVGVRGSSSAATTELWTARGLGVGQFAEPVIRPLARYFGGPRVADVDGDGAPDVVLETTRSEPDPDGGVLGITELHVLLDRGGDLVAQPHVDLPLGSWIVALSDIDGDGARDVVLGRNDAGDRAAYFLRNRDGGFPDPAERVPTLPDMLAYLVEVPGPPGVRRWISVSHIGGARVDDEDRFRAVRQHAAGPDGMPLSAPPSPFYDNLRAPLVVDLDGDGQVELVASPREFAWEEQLVVFARGPDGAFAPVSRFKGRASITVAADFDGDGRPDLVTDHADALSFLAGTAEANRSPVADGGDHALDRHGAVVGQIQASDSDGNPLRFELLEPPPRAALVIVNAESGEFLYQAEGGFPLGGDAFRVRVSDQSGGSTETKVRVHPRPASGGGGSDPSLLLGLGGLMATLAWRRGRSRAPGAGGPSASM